MKLIEIAPADNDRNCTESADVKIGPYSVKVSTQYLIYL